MGQLLRELREDKASYFGHLTYHLATALFFTGCRYHEWALLTIDSLRTPDTVELDWSQRGENEPQVGAWKEGLGGREFLAEMNQHGIVGRRAQAMEPHV